MIDGEMKWTETAITHMQLKSFIARVTRDGSRHKVLGVVLNDGTPLKSVEVRVDDGPWQPATMDPATSGKYSWKLFTYTWNGATPGEHTLVSRVTDVTGKVQPTAEELDNKKTFLEDNSQHPAEGDDLLTRLLDAAWQIRGIQSSRNVWEWLPIAGNVWIAEQVLSRAVFRSNGYHHPPPSVKSCERRDYREPFNNGRYSGLSEIVLWPVSASTIIDANPFLKRDRSLLVLAPGTTSSWSAAIISVGALT